MGDDVVASSAEMDRHPWTCKQH